MDIMNGGELHRLPSANRQDWVIDRCDFRRGRRWHVWRITQRCKGEGSFFFNVESEQCVDLLVHEAHHDASAQILRCANCQRVRQDRAAVPEGVAVGTCLVLNRVSPEYIRKDQNDRGSLYGRLIPAGLKQVAAVISLAQSGQRVGLWFVVIQPRWQTGKVSTCQVNLDVIQRAGAGRGAKVKLSPRGNRSSW